MHCASYCKHGGVCELEAGHEGLHDSRYCRWADAEAVPQVKADDIFRAGDNSGMAEVIIQLGNILDPRRQEN